MNIEIGIFRNKGRKGCCYGIGMGKLDMGYVFRNGGM